MLGKDGDSTPTSLRLFAAVQALILVGLLVAPAPVQGVEPQRLLRMTGAGDGAGEVTISPPGFPRASR